MPDRDFVKYQGESIRRAAVVYDQTTGEEADLTNATTSFEYFQGEGETSALACTVEDNVISAVIPPATTATMSGTYEYRFWVTLDGNVDMVAQGKFRVEAGKRPQGD
jgi:hypothetical protein